MDADLPRIQSVPDGAARQFLEAARDTLYACWMLADTPDPMPVPPSFPQDPHPKRDASKAVNALAGAYGAALGGEGADAVIGWSMIAKSHAKRAIAMRKVGVGFRAQEPPEGFQFVFNGRPE